MCDTQQVALFDVQGPLTELMARLSGENGKYHLGELKRFLRKRNLLEPITTIDLPACGRFVAKDELHADRDDINLWMSETFREKFLNKVEENVPAATIHTSKLLRNSRDLTNEDGSLGIIAELNGHEETTLHHLFSLLMKQPNGEKGTLLTDGKANIFYIRDATGVLWAVRAGRGGGDWDLDAYSVESPDTWHSGNLVVFCEVA